MRIHLFGASGSGCSSLGAALAEKLSLPLFDTDDFYWQQTDPPFLVRAENAERNQKLNSILQRDNGWVLAGSVSAWALDIRAQLSRAVLVYVPCAIRMQRLRARELLRYGNRVLPGGNMHHRSSAFLNWSEAYDQGNLSGRSLAQHERWLKTLPCPTLKIENVRALGTILDELTAWIEKPSTVKLREFDS